MRQPLTIPASNGNGSSEYFKVLAQQGDLLRREQQLKHLLRWTLEIVDDHIGHLRESEYPVEFGVLHSAGLAVKLSPELPSTEHLSKNQFNILVFIREYKQQHGGIAPTMDEISTGCDIGKTTVHANLRTLEVNRFVCLLKNKKGEMSTRGIQLAGEMYISPIWSNE